MSNKQRVLIVEDEEAIMLGLEENLKAAGYEVLTAAQGHRALKIAQESIPDLILLDVMIPGISGYEVCRELRDKGFQMPVIMLTARQEEFDKLHGFEMGADDYVTKPFSIQELLARVKAVLLRGKNRTEGTRKYEFEDCELNLDSRTLLRKGKDIPLTRTEFELLAYFCRNEGKALTRDNVMNDVWGTSYFGTQRSLDSFVASLRAKIEPKAEKPKHILTVHGVGYKFVRCGLLFFGLLVAPGLAATHEEAPVVGPPDSSRAAIQTPKDSPAIALLREQPRPADGSTVTTALTMLDWEDIEGASSYDIYFGTHASLGRSDRIGTDSLSQWSLVSPLNPRTTYYWKIVAKNRLGDSTSGVWRFITTAVPAPEVPSMPWPANGQTSISRSLVALDWADANGARGYGLYFGTTPKLGMDHFKGDITVSSWRLDCGLVPATEYYWRVVAKNAYGSTTGVVWRFTTAATPPPSVPSSPSPADGQTSVSLFLVTLDWADAKGAEWYSLYYGPTPKLGMEHFKGDITASSWRLGCDLVPATEYYWRVVAKNAYGSTTGTVWRFTTETKSKPSGFATVHGL